MNAQPKTPPPPPKAPPPSNGSNPIATASAAQRPGRLRKIPKGRRIIINGVEGVGKTSLAAYGPNPLIVMASQETGYETLLNEGRAPDCDVLHLTDWPETLASFRELAKEELPYELIAIDALGGLERVCHEHVCNTKFGGNWGEKGFTGYARGYEMAIAEWKQLLDELDRFKDRGVHILLLSHCQVRPFKNPLGDDFDQYKADCHHKTWATTHRWADAALFMTFLTDVREDSSGRKKGMGGTTRIMYTERRDAFDAKNRYGMPPCIEMPDDPAEMWRTLDYYMSQGRVETEQMEGGN